MSEDFDCAFNDSFECEFEDYVADIVIAKEACVCCECRAKITPGDRYEAASVWIDEEEQSYITCEPCAELRHHFSASYHGLIEEASEILFPYLTAGGPCVEGLSASAKGKLFEMWRRWKGLAA